MTLESVDQILDFAIGQEEEAAEFYTKLAGEMGKPWMRQVFLDFAAEEKGHKNKLLAVKDGKLLMPSAEKVMDLKMADYLVEVEPSPEMDYPAALILAMKKEKAAFKLYTDLSNTTSDANLKSALAALAQEEAKHKLRFEIEYDDYVMSEN